MSRLSDGTGLSHDVIYPGGRLDVLPYYGIVAKKLTGFLRGRELATRIWAPPGRIRSVVKRGSGKDKLYVAEMLRAITPELVRERASVRHPDVASFSLSRDQVLVWEYFMPGRYVEWMYVPNGEGPGRAINRIVFSILRGRGSTAEDACETASLLVKAVQSDEMAREYFTEEPLVSWTGDSFDVTVFLRSAQAASFYESHIAFTGGERTLTDRLVKAVAGQFNGRVSGHRSPPAGSLTIDTSQTPSGNTSRVPLGSLYVTEGPALSGVSVPLRPDMLSRSIVSDLKSYTPGRIVDEIDDLARRLRMRENPVLPA